MPSTRSHALSLLIVALAACGAEPPVHFPQSERHWQLPLAQEVGDGGLVVPVTIAGSGPYRFLLAPDAAVSTIDRGLAAELDLYSGPDSWRSFVDHQDHLVTMRPYEVLHMQAGDLHIENFVVFGAPKGSLEVGGVPIQGIIGSNLLTRTVVIDVDRSRRVVVLSITGSAAPLEQSWVVRGHTWTGRFPRKLVVDATIDGLGPVELAVDLASPRSALRADRLAELNAPATPTPHVWRDEFGTASAVHYSKSAQLDLGLGVRQNVQWTELPDRRLRTTDVDGVLGLDAFAGQVVRFDPDRREISLRPALQSQGDGRQEHAAEDKRRSPRLSQVWQLAVQSR